MVNVTKYSIHGSYGIYIYINIYIYIYIYLLPKFDWPSRCFFPRETAITVFFDKNPADAGRKLELQKDLEISWVHRSNDDRMIGVL